MTEESVRLPQRIIWVVVVLSALPGLLQLCGANLSVESLQLTAPDSVETLVADDEDAMLLQIFAGSFVHTFLEWTAFCIALFTAVFAFVHFYLRRDVTTPAIGTALFFAGMIDAFHTLAADGLIGTVADRDQFIAFTWSISRTFHVCILIAGTAPFLWGTRSLNRSQSTHGVRFILLVAFMYGLLAYMIIYLCATSVLPTAIYPDRVIPRPWDAIPLLLYLLAGGIIFPRFHKMQPSLFSSGLIVSVIPHVAAQAHAAFGSTQVFDGHANAASALKIVAYIVPLMGLLLDYTRAHKAEAELLATQQQLQMARRIQQGLLPQSAPSIEGFDLAGASRPAEAIGGDYFDFIPMRHGKLGVVIADVSGHEIGTALVVAQTHSYLRALANSHDDAGAINTDLNRFLAHDVRDRMFVSVFFAQLDPAAHKFTYAAAGHEAYLLKHSGETHRLERL